MAQCFVHKYPGRMNRLILLNTGVPDERLGRAAMRGKPVAALLPFGLLRSLIGLGLSQSRVLSTRPGEQAFWRAMLHDLIGQLTRALPRRAPRSMLGRATSRRWPTTHPTSSLCCAAN